MGTTPRVNGLEQFRALRPSARGSFPLGVFGWCRLVLPDSPRVAVSVRTCISPKQNKTRKEGDLRTQARQERRQRPSPMSLTELQGAPSSQWPQITAQGLAGERGEQKLTLGHNRHAKSLDQGCGTAVPSHRTGQSQMCWKTTGNPKQLRAKQNEDRRKTHARSPRRVDCVTPKQPEAAHTLLKKVLIKRKAKGLRVPDTIRQFPD